MQRRKGVANEETLRSRPDERILQEGDGGRGARTRTGSGGEEWLCGKKLSTIAVIAVAIDPITPGRATDADTTRDPHSSAERHAAPGRGG